jgi:hypothetical protein
VPGQLALDGSTVPGGPAVIESVAVIGCVAVIGGPAAVQQHRARAAAP